MRGDRGGEVLEFLVLVVRRCQDFVGDTQGGRCADADFLNLDSLGGQNDEGMYEEGGE